MTHEQRQKLLPLIDESAQLSNEEPTWESLERSREVTQQLRQLSRELGCVERDDGDIADDLAVMLSNSDYAAIKSRLRAEIERSRELFAPCHEQASPMR